MADSDNSTFVPVVIPQEPRSNGALRQVSLLPDTTLALSQVWRVAHLRTLALCDRQQKLEASIWSGGLQPENAEHYGIESGSTAEARCSPVLANAKVSENEAALRADRLFDQLFATQAPTLMGVIAKLDALLMRSEVEDSPDSFPWPQLRSVVADLKSQAAAQDRDRLRGS